MSDATAEVKEAVGPEAGEEPAEAPAAAKAEAAQQQRPPAGPFVRRLPGANVVRFGERAGDKGGRRRQPPVFNREHHHLVLRLDRDVHPGLCRMDI